MPNLYAASFLSLRGAKRKYISSKTKSADIRAAYKKVCDLNNQYRLELENEATKMLKDSKSASLKSKCHKTS